MINKGHKNSQEKEIELNEVIDKERLVIIKITSTHLDASNARDLKKQLMGVLDKKQSQDVSVIIDLSKVTFIDSAGLGSLISLYKFLGSSQRMCVANATSPVIELFKLTHVNSLFINYPTLEEAKRHFE